MRQAVERCRQDSVATQKQAVISLAGVLNAQNKFSQAIPYLEQALLLEKQKQNPYFRRAAVKLYLSALKNLGRNEKMKELRAQNPGVPN